jgi:hypothetical protein
MKPSSFHHQFPLNSQKLVKKSQSWKKRVQNKEKLNYNKNAMKFLVKQILSFEKKKVQNKTTTKML